MNNNTDPLRNSTECGANFGRGYKTWWRWRKDGLVPSPDAHTPTGDPLWLQSTLDRISKQLLSDFLLGVAERIKRDGNRMPYRDRSDEIERVATELRRSASIFRDLEAADVRQEGSDMT